MKEEGLRFRSAGRKQKVWKIKWLGQGKRIVGSVTRIWSVRNFRSPLKRYWVGFHEDVFIHGENAEQSGVLSICPPEETSSITAHLKVFGREVVQVLQPGEDISVRIHGLELIVGVRAVEDARLLLEFGIPEGSHASLTLAEQ